MLTRDQIAFYHENGYLRVENVFTQQEIKGMSAELEELIQTWGVTDRGWQGPWRERYLTADQNERSRLIHLHDLHLYSQAWCRAVVSPRLAEAMSDLIGPNVELHHTTLHAKPPEAGTAFPLHQDYPFYPHENAAYVDALIHVDNADAESGCLSFLVGSHKLGPLPHIMEGSPHLPVDEYRFSDTVLCPAKAGDVVCFSINTIHGSAINRSGRWRRLVRCGYRDPLNKQISGQACGRPGLMVWGVRPRTD
jgi:ectoine hydroxylase-related dioxygenase (phytanoyl-CoA dioxygenase family)